MPVATGVTPCIPLTASVPLQAPLAVQLVALAEDQLRVELLPRTRLAGLAAMVTVGNGGAVTVTVAVLVTLPPLPVQVRS